MSNSSEPSFFQQALELYEQGKYTEGYTLVTEHAAESPAYLQKSFYFRLCLSAKSGDLTLAEEILEDALDQGYFFSEAALRKEDDLKGLFDDIDVNSNKLGSSVEKRNQKRRAPIIVFE